MCRSFRLFSILLVIALLSACGTTTNEPRDLGYFFELHVGDEMRCGVGFSLYTEPLYPALNARRVVGIDAAEPVYCLVVRYEDYSSYAYLDPLTGSSADSVKDVRDLPLPPTYCLIYYCSTAPFTLEITREVTTGEAKTRGVGGTMNIRGDTTLYFDETYTDTATLTVSGVTWYLQSTEPYEPWFPVETMMGDYKGPAPYYNGDGIETFLHYADQIRW